MTGPGRGEMTVRPSMITRWAPRMCSIYLVFVLCLMLFLPLQYASGKSSEPYWATPSGGPCNRYLSTQDGKHNLGGPEWEVDLGEDLSLRMAVGNDGTIYAVERSGETTVHAIGPGGKLEWEADYGLDELMSPSISANGTLVLMGSREDRETSVLMMLDKAGLPIYIEEVPGRPLFSPVPDDRGGLLVGTYGYKDDWIVIHYRSPSGEVLWNITFPKYRYDEPDEFVPAMDPEGRVYLVASFLDDDPMCISPNGTLLWTRGMYYVERAPPLITHEGNLVFETDGGLLCLSPGGSEVWRMSLGRSPSSNIALSSDGLIYLFSGYDENLVAIDSTSGNIVLEKRNSYDDPDKIIIADDGTIFGVEWDTITSWSRDGSERWYKSLWDDIDDIAMGNGGTIYVTTEYGVMAIRGDDNSTILVIAWCALAVLSITSLFGIAYLYKRGTDPPRPVLPASVLGPKEIKRVRCTRCSNVFPIPDGLSYITCPRCGLVSKEIW
ncbi:MAG: PQQ-binding-like beta-propeller repeat protein [Thermoplasmatota archaeon]